MSGISDIKKYDTVIFDLDGTLLNTLEDLTDSTNFVLSSFGYAQRTIEEVRTFVGNGIGRYLKEQFRKERTTRISMICWSSSNLIMIKTAITKQSRMTG